MAIRRVDGPVRQDRERATSAERALCLVFRMARCPQFFFRCADTGRSACLCEFSNASASRSSCSAISRSKRSMPAAPWIGTAVARRHSLAFRLSSAARDFGMGLPPRLSSAATQSHCRRQRAALLRILRRRHRVVSWKLPLRPTGLWRQAVSNPQVALHGLGGGATFQAGQSIGGDPATRRNHGSELLKFNLRMAKASR